MWASLFKIRFKNVLGFSYQNVDWAGLFIPECRQGWVLGLYIILYYYVRIVLKSIYILSNGCTTLCWKSRQNKLLIMTKLAIKILGIPATSAPSERAFSSTGRMIEEKRTCLRGDTVKAIMFLNDYYKK